MVHESQLPKNINEFEQLLNNWEKITIDNEHTEDNMVTIRNIKNTEAIYVVEAMVLAYDSGFKFGAFFANKGKGSLTIYE